MRLVSVGVLSQQEALANADSATNLLWLLGNGLPDKAAETAPAPAAEQPFSTFKLDT
jgi:twitching motility protein PilU